MKKLYEKSELSFALLWIAVYCVGQLMLSPISRIIGIKGSARMVFNAALSIIFFIWIWKNGLLEQYGLCRAKFPARKFLWYLPLAVLISLNLWNGIAIHFPLADTICTVCYKFFIGVVEEVLFRGFLFKAIAKKNNVKQAVVISSVTFGLGHLLNLLNGTGLVANLCQVFMAIAIGFLFVTIFYRGESLIPCIITHSGIDMAGVFSNDASLTDQRRILLIMIPFVISVLYTLILVRTLPEPETQQTRK